MGLNAGLITTNQKTGRETEEMILLRPVDGRRKSDRIQNHEVREEVNILPITEDINNYQTNWHDHAERTKKHPFPQIF
jgi:hypothetical protein